MKNFIGPLKKLTVNIYTSGLHGKHSIEYLRQIILMNTMYTLGLLLLIPYGIVAYSRGQILLGLFDHLAALVLAISGLLLRKLKNILFIKYLSLIVMVALFIYFIFASEIGNTGLLWAFTLPLFTLFFLGGKAGSVATFFYFGIVLVCFFFDIPHNRFSFDFKIRFSGTYIAVWGLSFFFEYIRIKTQKRIKQQNLELNKTVDELRRIQNALQQSESKYRHLVESANVGILIIEEGKVKLANPHIMRLAGYTADEVLDTPFEQYLVPEERERVKDIYTRRIRGEDAPDIYESALRHKNGSRLEIEISVTQLTYDLRPAELVFLRDITEKKTAIVEKEQLEARLRQSQKMEAIGQLAGGVAHDFNNMLAGISGFANVIKRQFKNIDPQLDRYVNSIITASERATDLTTKLLAFARKGIFQMYPVDMHEIINVAIRILERTIDKRIEIKKDFGAKKAVVLGDPTQLENMILNLAVNARDAMPNGGRLTFSSQELLVGEDYTKNLPYKMGHGRYLQISVSDTGLGIEESIMGKLFEPFFTTKNLGEGTGLGLASVYGTVKKHDGFIEVQSEVGKGSTFIILLGLLDKRGQKPKLSVEEPKYGRGHILVIDDEEVVRDVALEILKDLGYTATVCEDGEQAIAYYKDNFQSVDLVITDITMPKLSGYDCFKELKTINPKVKVLVSSGYSIDGEAKRFINEGAMGFIQKPFDFNRLSAIIFDILRK
jgi:PAS domain S-box-containing protein